MPTTTASSTKAASKLCAPNAQPAKPQNRRSKSSRRRSRNASLRFVDAALGKLKTPSLALKLADVSDGMDDTQLATAIDKLLESCPELAAEPATKSTEDPFRFANHVKSTPQNAHDMNALAFGNMVRTALNQ